MSDQHRRHRLGEVLLWLLAALLVVNILRHLDRYLWDFKVYYHAAEAFSRGGDPYQTATLRHYAQGTPQSDASTYLPFLYPPLTLYGFRVWTLLPVMTAARLWFVLKLACLAGLLALWDRFFVPLRRSAFVMLFCLLAFNRVIYIDLISGNISLFEEGLIWAGVWGLLRGRPLRGGLCIALAAQIKIAPILFLLLWLVVPPRPRWAAFCASSAAFAGLFCVNFILPPALFRQFLIGAKSVDERGTSNPSTLAFLHDVQDQLALHGLRLPHNSAGVVFLILVAFFLTLSARAWPHSRRLDTSDSLPLVLFFCTLYALCLPRFSAYTYVLLLIPGLFVLRHEPRRSWVNVAAFLMLLPGGMIFLSNLPVLRAAWPVYLTLPALLRDYLPLWSAVLIWGLLLRRVRAYESG